MFFLSFGWDGGGRGVVLVVLEGGDEVDVGHFLLFVLFIFYGDDGSFIAFTLCFDVSADQMIILSSHLPLLSSCSCIILWC
jgi:hypothetical protein